MSLIRVRRQRKSGWIDARKGMSSNRLLALFGVVVLVIWYLGWRY